MLRAAALVLACLVLSGCEDVLTTTKLDPVQDDRILGKWTDPDGDSFEVLRNGPGYKVSEHGETDSSSSTEFTLVRAGGALFLQVPDKCSNHAFSYEADTRTCYRMSKLDLSDSEFSMYDFALEGFQKESAAGRVKIQHKIAVDVSPTGEKTTCALIEGSAEELTALLASYPKDAFGKADRIRRAK